MHAGLLLFVVVVVAVVVVVEYFEGVCDNYRHPGPRRVRNPGSCLPWMDYISSGSGGSAGEFQEGHF